MYQTSTFRFIFKINPIFFRSTSFRFAFDNFWNDLKHCAEQYGYENKQTEEHENVNELVHEYERGHEHDQECGYNVSEHTVNFRVHTET